jgi:hypothetical protein
MSLQVEYYKKNPLDHFGYGKHSKQKQKEEAFINLKSAFDKEDLSLKEYLFAVASQIEPTEYLNEPVCGGVLGGLEVDIIAKVAENFCFDLNDTCSRKIMNSEIERENINFDVANLGGLIGKGHDVDNPVISTNATYFLPSTQRPNDSMASVVDQVAFDKSMASDNDIHSSILHIPLIPKVNAPVFPAVTPLENSVAYNICYECSESLGNKGMSCPQCKESYHIKCHVPPKYVTISAYYQKQGLKNWKCSLCKPPKSK